MKPPLVAVAAEAVAAWDEVVFSRVAPGRRRRGERQGGGLLGFFGQVVTKARTPRLQLQLLRSNV